MPLAVALVPSGLFTATATLPATCAGVTTEIEVADNDVTAPATPPNVTVAPLSKPLPVIVTAVPPAVPPDVGENPDMLTLAAGEYVAPFDILFRIPALPTAST